MSCTIVLIHGGFAESSRRDGARAHGIVAVPGASHSSALSRPHATAHSILEAAALRVAA
jgi:hypothetical protein